MSPAPVAGTSSSPVANAAMAKVKICGITSLAALDAALLCGADYIGLVFFAKSPRYIDFDVSKQLAARARGRAQIVALAVNPDPDLLGTLYQDVRPDIIQLHGTEAPEFVANVRHLMPGVGIWKALPVAETSDVGAVAKYMQPGELADLILFDAKPAPGAKLPGGNGLSFDWTILEGLADRFPFVLAGGLNPDNVAAAIKLTKAAVVDVSSGVESRPGKKNPVLIERFIAAAKPVGQSAA